MLLGKKIPEPNPRSCLFPGVSLFSSFMVAGVLAVRLILKTVSWGELGSPHWDGTRVVLPEAAGMAAHGEGRAVPPRCPWPSCTGVGKFFFPPWSSSPTPHPSPSHTLQYFAVSLQCPFRKAAGRGKEEGMKEEKQTNKGQRARCDSGYVEHAQEKLPLTSGG